jgi:hypothetical protein
MAYRQLKYGRMLDRKAPEVLLGKALHFDRSDRLHVAAEVLPGSSRVTVATTAKPASSSASSDPSETPLNRLAHQD